ncbi:hypothetical protein ACQ4PT_038076 [Festuca glaucescens]
MGGFNPPVPQQDNNTEIRVAVLLSLLLQVVILITGRMRKRSSSPLIRFAIWSSYLLADWVADLALGLLLNNMGNIGGNSSQSQHASGLSRGPAAAPDSSSPVIFAFWTPFLLVHLGGQDSLTALSIQDNDLWLRSLIGLLFQLFSTCVIFFCSLKGNPMIAATVLVFVVGIIKYGERIYSLYSGSVDAILAEIIRDPDPGPNYAKFMNLYRAKENAGLPVELVVQNPPRGRARSYGYTSRRELEKNCSLEAQAYMLFCMFRQLCFDVTPSYKELMKSQAYFVGYTNVAAPVSPEMAFEVIELELNFMYDTVHTKEPITHTKAGCVLRFVGSTCLVSALLIFFFHPKGGITRVDVAITYLLLLGGMALDAAALAMLVFSNRTVVFMEENKRLAWLARAVRSLRPRQQRWREDTSQLNLIGYCLGNPGASRDHRFCSTWRVVRTLAMVARKLHISDTFHGVLFIRRVPLSSTDLQCFVFDGLKARAIKAIEELDIVHKRISYPGEGVLEMFEELIMKSLTHGCSEAADAEEDEAINNNNNNNRKAEYKFAVLRRSLERRGFDQSLLMWHIATDLCCHPIAPTAPTMLANRFRLIAETLSGYMLYLLIKQPKILLGSAGIGLKRYQDTCAEAKRFFQSEAAWDPVHSDARRMLLSVDTTREPSELKGSQCKSVLFDAVILAKVLRDIGHGGSQTLMWEVVSKVWVQMLTYAAGKCKGSTHVQQLSRGGELITMVWFLMAHMGLSDDVYKSDLDLDKEVLPKLIVHH